MAQNNIWFTVNLQSATQMQVVHGNFFTADNLGAVIGAHVMDGSAPAELSGTVFGYIIRSDGDTVEVTGNLNGNDVSIALPESAVAVPGPIQVAIRLKSGDVKTVLLALTGFVQRDKTGTIIDPGHVIPDIDDVIAKLDEMDAKIAETGSAIDAAEAAAVSANNATKYIAETEATSTAAAAHANGSNLIYNGKLYQATADIAIGDTLTVGTNIAEIPGGVSGQVADLKSALNYKIDQIVITDPTIVTPELSLISGYIKNDGSHVATSGWRCTDYLDVSSAENKTINIKSTIYGNGGTAWYDSDNVFIAALSGANASEYGLVSQGEPQEYTLTLPAHAKYIRISGYGSNPDISLSYTEPNIQPGKYLQTLFDVEDSKIQAVSDELHDFTGVPGQTVEAEFNIVVGLVLNTGIVSPSSSWEASDFVDVSNAAGHQVTIHSTVYGSASTAWYDSSKALIGAVNGNNASDYGITASEYWQTYTITLPSNAVYVRISGYLTRKTDGDVLSVTYAADPIPGTVDVLLAQKIDVAQGVEQAGKALIVNENGQVVPTELPTPEDPTDLRNDVETLKEIVGEPQYINLINPALMVESTYIVGATGARAASNYYNSSDFVLMEAEKTYYVGGFYFGTAVYHAFYSEPNELTFLSNADVTVTNDSNSHATIVIGAESVYARFSALRTVSEQYVSSYVDYYVAYAGPITLQEMVTPKCRFKKVLVLGDSISTDNYGNYKKWVTDLIDEGFFPADTVNSSQHASGFVARYNNQPNDFITRLTGIANPETYDLVITFGGINDANKLIPMGTETDTDYLTYFGAAVRYYYKYLCTNFINARIATLLPLPCSTQNREAAVVGVQYTYSAYQNSVCEAYSLPVLDLTNHSGFHPDANKPGIDYAAAQAFRMRWTLKVEDYAPDGIHPTEEYEKKFLAPMIKAFIETL